jgi:hypothetical protein
MRALRSALPPHCCHARARQGVQGGAEHHLHDHGQVRLLLSAAHRHRAHCATAARPRLTLSPFLAPTQRPAAPRRRGGAAAPGLRAHRAIGWEALEGRPRRCEAHMRAVCFRLTAAAYMYPALVAPPCARRQRVDRCGGECRGPAGRAGRRAAAQRPFPVVQWGGDSLVGGVAFEACAVGAAWCDDRSVPQSL